MNVEQNRKDWSFLLRWVVLVSLAFMVATALAFTSMWSIGDVLLQRFSTLPAALVSGAWAGGLMGLGLGIGQVIMLRGAGVNTTRWVVYSALGGAAAFALFAVVTAEGDSMRTSLALLAGGLMGVAIGVAQWSLIRHRASAVIWIVTTTIALVLTMMTIYTLSGEGREWLTLIASGQTVAGITGLGASRLFRNARPAIAGQVGVLLIAGLLLAGCGGGGSAEPGVRFAEPSDGASVAAPVRVVMAAENFTVEPAGDGTVHEGAGHLHIMVDTPCIEAGNTIPKDETHLHFGDGSTETELDLAPGSHTLCLQAADGAHTALPGEGMTHTISVTVP